MLNREEIIQKFFLKAKPTDRILYLESIDKYACATPKGLYLEDRNFIPLDVLKELKKETLTGKLALATAATMTIFHQ